MLFAAPLGELPFFFILVQGPYFQNKIQGGKRKNRFLEKCFLYSIACIIVEKIKSYIKNLVDTFLLSKKGTFPKKSIAQF